MDEVRFTAVCSATEKPRETELAEALLAYLAECPHATDTLEGIAEWWLLRQQVRNEVETVARVVAELTTQGLLEEVPGVFPPCYRRKERAGESSAPRQTNFPTNNLSPSQIFSEE